jgi:hypothetical protein
MVGDGEKWGTGRKKRGVLWREEKLHRRVFMAGGRRRRVAVGLRAAPREPTAQ